MFPLTDSMIPRSQTFDIMFSLWFSGYHFLVYATKHLYYTFLFAIMYSWIQGIIGYESAVCLLSVILKGRSAQFRLIIINVSKH